MQGVPETFDHLLDRAEFRRPCGMAGVELYRARIVRHRFAPHLHDGYGLGVIEAGQERFDYRGREHLAPAGAIVMMQPGELHTGGPASSQGWRYRMLYLDEAVLSEQLGGERTWSFDQVVRQRDTVRAGALAESHRRLWLAGDALAADGALADVLALLAPLAVASREVHLSAVPDTPRPFRRVVDALHTDFTREWRLADLAALEGLSPFHFQRAFKAAHGLSAHQMRMALRVAEAKRRLARGEPAADIAAAVGLADQAHLTRRFAGMYGVTPARYRQQVNARRS